MGGEQYSPRSTEQSFSCFDSLYCRRVSKIDIGMWKMTSSYTWRGLVCYVAAILVRIVEFWHERPTSYCVIRPLGSTGSSHLRKIMSSSGVKVRDSGAMPPGTIAGDKTTLAETNTSLGSQAYGPCAQTHQGGKTPLTEREGAGTRMEEEVGQRDRLLPALGMNRDLGFNCLITTLWS